MWAMARHTGEMQNRHGRGRICLLLAALVFWRRRVRGDGIKESQPACVEEASIGIDATSKVAGVPPVH
jgi:hypothetical protein